MLILLAILVFVYNFTAALYLMTGVEPLPTVEFLYPAAFACGSIWWLNAERRKAALAPVYCQGMLIGLGWFVMIPYYLFKTRGLKAFWPLLLLVGSFLLAQIMAATVYRVFLASGE